MKNVIKTQSELAEIRGRRQLLRSRLHCHRRECDGTAGHSRRSTTREQPIHDTLGGVVSRAIFGP